MENVVAPVNPVCVELVTAVPDAGVAVAKYESAVPVNVMTADALPGNTELIKGVFAITFTIMAVAAVDAVPEAFTAVTVNVYVVPLVNPVAVMELAPATPYHNSELGVGVGPGVAVGAGVAIAGLDET